MQDKIVLIFFGPPGSGKGTQGKIISQRLGIPHIATGDIMREAVANETELGKKVKDYLGRGLLVPDEIVIQIIEERLKRDDVKKGFILDGFPRTVEQARALEGLFKKLSIQNYMVLYFDVPDEDIIKRISGRRSCVKCGSVYNVFFGPPKTPNKCDSCGSDLIVREDDTEEKVKKRLDVYKQSTLPVLDFYSSKVKKISAVGKIEEITESIVKIIQN
ncbi:MAG: adenylate kinase [Candidatus Calescibacterium sp.]|nr:adenylate kinase [Candidatus Calescibacterium sp.]MCX7734834.1 adenylate kinase [bacterium]